MGTLYRESAGPCHPHYLQHNEVLLRAVATQVCLYSTGRVSSQGISTWANEYDVSAVEILESAGFKDVQFIANHRWGKPSSTHVNVSPGLISYTLALNCKH